MTEHTQGPWHAEPSPSSTFATRSIYATREDKDIHIADVGTRGRLEPAEDVANAHLIAAAPVLLAALREVTHALRWHVDQGRGVAMDAEYVRRALAAIAAAEGRAHD